MSRKVTVKGKLVLDHLDVARNILFEVSGLILENRSFAFSYENNGLNQSEWNEKIAEAERLYQTAVEEKLRRIAAEKARIEAERKRLEEERRRLEEERRTTVNRDEILRQLGLLDKQDSRVLAEEEAVIEEELRQAEQVVAAAEERERIRSERESAILANAMKHGYQVKQKIVEGNKVKLVLQRREY